ncbi:MAG TPA: cytochrome P450 [Steroidobacteraceae bacterium]|nr:cytochrome P450 [Steroidobacteraceae bacterium]
MPPAPHPEDFDPLLPETADSPYELFRQLRAHRPVAWSNAWNGFWSLSRYADVARTASDYTTFINSVQNVVPKVAFTGRRPPLHLDPPAHTPFRQVLNPLLSERRIQHLQPVVRRICADLLSPLISAGQGNLCEDFSSRLPVHVFAEWMHIPPQMSQPLRETGRAFNVAVQSNSDSIVRETSLALYAMARELIAMRKREPADPCEDPTSALLAARHAGEPLPDELLVGCVRQVLVVGIIAPTVIIGSIGVHLSRDRELQQRLRENPRLIPAALEEFLRLYTPYRGFARTANRDVQISGCPIRAGEPIALNYASANRDEEVFAAPDEFHLGRPNIGQSLAFGRGPHHCPGAALARLQLRVALEELLARTGGFETIGPIIPTRMPELGVLSVNMRFSPPTQRRNA